MKLTEVKKLLLELTNRCNGRCIMCWRFNNKTLPAYEISEELYTQVRDKLFPHIREFYPGGGGEVFLYSRFREVMQDVKKYGFKVKISSNFSTITEEQKQILKDIDVDFQVSLDGSYKELQEFIRPNCTFETVIDNIKTFVHFGKKIALSVTLSNHNFYNMEKILELSDELGVDEVRLHGVQYLPGTDKPYRFSKPQIDMAYLDKVTQRKFKTRYYIKLYDYFYSSLGFKESVLESLPEMKELVKDGFCPRTANTVYIQGDKVLTCHLLGNKVVGDLAKNTLEEIIDNEVYDDIRRTCSCDFRKTEDEFMKNYEGGSYGLATDD